MTSPIATVFVPDNMGIAISDHLRTKKIGFAALTSSDDNRCPQANPIPTNRPDDGNLMGSTNATDELNISRIKRMFKWASRHELVPSTLYHGLVCVEGLRRSRSGAREAAPVAWERVETVLPYVSPPVAAMIQVQYLCGMRPGEVVIMRRCDLDTSDEIWLESRECHTNSWRGQKLVKAVPKAAQTILARFFGSLWHSPILGWPACWHPGKSQRCILERIKASASWDAA